MGNSLYRQMHCNDNVVSISETVLVSTVTRPAAWYFMAEGEGCVFLQSAAVYIQDYTVTPTHNKS
jgi:hypothetical protein